MRLPIACALLLLAAGCARSGATAAHIGPELPEAPEVMRFVVTRGGMFPAPGRLNAGPARVEVRNLTGHAMTFSLHEDSRTRESLTLQPDGIGSVDFVLARTVLDVEARWAGVNGPALAKTILIGE